MIRSSISFSIAALVAAVLVPLAPADDLAAWEFDDSADTRLSGAADTEGTAGRWSAAFDGSGTTGDGTYRLARGTGGTSNAFAAIDAPDDGTLSATYVLESWALRGSKTGETLRLGFVHKTHDKKPSVLCQFKLERTSEDELTLRIEAFGDGSADVTESISLDAASDEPLTLRLDYDADADRYAGHYALGDRDLTRLGGAATSPERAPKHLRIGATGSFDSNATKEFVAIDRVAVTTGGD